MLMVLQGQYHLELALRLVPNWSARSGKDIGMEILEEK